MWKKVTPPRSRTGGWLLFFFTFLLLVGSDEKDDLTCKKSEKQKLRKMLIYLICSKAPWLIKPEPIIRV
jgi:hypothetical protein